MQARRVQLYDMAQLQFAGTEVLHSEKERREREHKLKTAMMLTNSEHEEISLFVQLADGEIVEVVSSLIDLEGDYVEVRGGYDIPVRAIVNVGV
jgi:N-acetylglutamate synthase/N-acetylornithine aminotransferase